MANTNPLDIREAEDILANLTAGSSLPISPECLADQAAEAYLVSTTDLKPGEPVYLDLLCTLAVSDSRATSSMAVSTLYRRIIEGFCDDFSNAGTVNANRTLAHLIRFVGRLNFCSSLGQRLSETGLVTESAFLKRWQKITVSQPVTGNEKKTVRRIVIPSRVSAGADIVITSIMIHRLLTSFNDAEIILIGPDHLTEIFHNIPRVSHHVFGVRRHGSLTDRVMFWPRLEKTIRNITRGLNDNEVMIFDPDSRLSQLGLLPLSANFRTCHFPSRSMLPFGENSSLSEITNQWLDTLLGPEEHIVPRVSLAQNKKNAVASFFGILRKNGCEKIIVANFGVGGDGRKQMADPFEEQVLNQILLNENSIIILDMGCGPEEKSKTEKLIAKMARAGLPTALTDDAAMTCFNPGFKHGIVGACTSIGSLAALIDSADSYLGYDSSGQHLAAAVSTPSVTLFAGYPNPRFLERWSPVNTKTGNSVIPVPEPAPNFLAAIDELAETTAKALNKYLQ